MTSNEPPKESLRDRISYRLSTGRDGKFMDADEQHTRNVSWIFYGIIVAIVVVIVGGLLYGFWESNLKPAATVNGRDISRAELADRQQLKDFRAARFQAEAQAALAAGEIDATLANTRFGVAESLASSGNDGTDASELAGLVLREQLAAEEGVALTEEELEAAVAADGAAPESRLADILIVLTPEQGQGLGSSEEGIADARERALAAMAELGPEADLEALAETYGPAEFQSFYVWEGSTSVPEFEAAVFAAEEGDVIEPVAMATGQQLVAYVGTIVPEMPDEGFVAAVNDEVGEAAHRRNVELEAISDKLEQHITDEALEAEYEQVRLGEIFIERNPVTADDDAGEARASHIIYAPETPLDEEGNPTDVAELPADDPAWAAAEAEAQAAFDELTAIADAEARKAAFAERAMAESDGPSAPEGGDLGWFPQEGVMVPEFSAPIWENIDPQSGDVLGPVRTEFGWHVILFDEFRSSLNARVREVERALEEEGADFEAVAAEYTEDPDGPAAEWWVIDNLDEALIAQLDTLDVGDIAEPVDEGDGFYFYQLQEQDTRPLNEDDAALVRQNAFADWYDLNLFSAQDEGRFSVDDSLYEE
jgi:parvulin-like peptidyl-prolyl isomerase